MEETKLNREAIIGKFCTLDTECLLTEGEAVDVEELTGTDIDTLMEDLCEEGYNPIEFYTNLIQEYGDSDDGYVLQLSDEEENLSLFTYFDEDLDCDTVSIDSKKGFRPAEIFAIIDAINSQSHFYDLYIAFEEEDTYSTAVYHGESFGHIKEWIDDLMTQFRQGELDRYHGVTITSNFDELDLEPNDEDVRDNRLYVKFDM